MADAEDLSSQERTLKGKDEKAASTSAAFVKDRYEAGVKAIKKEIHEYWLNHAFLEGDQWIYYNTETRRLDTVPRDPDRLQATVDRMGPASRAVISKLISRPLSFEVPPTAADDASLQGAYTAKSIVESVKVEHDWEQLREANAWAVWKGGTAALAVEWNPRAGRPVGASQATGREFGTGDTVEISLNITEFVVEPGVREGEKARWWIKALALPPEEAQATYGLKKKPAADASAGMSPAQAKLLASSNGGDGVDKPELTLVYTYYERPNPLTPKGKVMTVIDDQVVEGPFDWPFPFKDRLNLVITRESVLDSRWVGHTVVSKARPVQVLYNVSWSSIAEHMKNAGNARLAIPASSVDMIDQFSDLPGEMFTYPDGMEVPQYVSPPQMPGWWIQQPEMLARQIDDILGYHDVSRGVTPANVESGVGISILSENDSTPTGRLIQDTARAFGQLGTLVLEIYADKVHETRNATVAMPGYPPEQMEWTGRDLMKQTRTIVPLDAIVPRSRAAQEQLAQKALELGLISGFAQFAEIAELPDRHSLVQSVAPDVARARRENHAMALGRVALVEPWDDDNVHLQELNDFRKSPRYELLGPEEKEVFALHAQAHETSAAEKAGRLAGQMNANPLLAASPNATGPVPLMGGPEGAGPLASAPGMPGEEGPDGPANAAMMPKPDESGTMPGAPPAL